MKNEQLDESAEWEVMELSEKLLKFLDNSVPKGKYTHINMSLNVIIATLFRISDTYLPNMEEKKKFAVQMAKQLILNYENAEKYK